MAPHGFFNEPVTVTTIHVGYLGVAAHFHRPWVYGLAIFQPQTFS
jgi:hypothetical protein